MKIISSTCAFVSAIALFIAPLSIEISSSLFVSAGIIALLANEYGSDSEPVGMKV